MSNKMATLPLLEYRDSNAANIGERKTWTESEFCAFQNSIRGQELSKMYI